MRPRPEAAGAVRYHLLQAAGCHSSEGGVPPFTACRCAPWKESDGACTRQEHHGAPARAGHGPYRSSARHGDSSHGRPPLGQSASGRRGLTAEWSSPAHLLQNACPGAHVTSRSAVACLRVSDSWAACTVGTRAAPGHSSRSSGKAGDRPRCCPPPLSPGRGRPESGSYITRFALIARVWRDLLPCGLHRGPHATGTVVTVGP